MEGTVKNTRSHTYLTQLVVSIILPFLVMMNFGTTPTMAAGATLPALLSPSEGSLEAACVPSITFTTKPQFGSLTERRLYGRIDCANSADFKLAIYIYVPGWWIKPSFTNPLTTINPDGTWQTTVVTGGLDHLAT